MAKLTNVATVDMVNGEITKVAYEGAEYALVSGDGKIGDLAQCIRELSFFTNGEFYEVTEISDGGSWVHAIDDVGDRYHMEVAKSAKIFRKISEECTDSPTIEERVTALESDVAALKGEKANESYEYKVGDKVRMLSESLFGKPYKGETGTVVEKADEDGDINVKPDNGGAYGLFKAHQLELVTQANETIEFEGAEYRKVDREAREGDVVVLTGDDLPRWFTKGKAYKIGKGPYIKKSDSGHKNYTVYDAGYGRTRETVDVYEPIEQAKYVPQEGDIVVITANNTASRNAVGDIGKVGKVTSYDATVDVPGKPKPHGANGNYTAFGDIRKATPAEVEQYEKALHKASFAVGDYVKIVKSERGNVGKIVKITGDSDGYKMRMLSGEVVPADFQGTTLGDDKVYGFTADQLVKATDAEIAKATAPKLKAGDFVKITRKLPHYDNNKSYEIVEKDGRLGVIDEDGDFNCGAITDDKYEIVDAETAKWAKIGRKVGEFKKGDVAEVVEYNCGHKVGTIVKITDDSGDLYRAFAQGSTYSYAAKRLKLVAPVESLFTTQN